MTAAIYYHPEAYTTSGPKLMGRNAAGESFLRGFLAHSHTDAFWAQVEKPEHAKVFAASVQAAGRTELVKAVDKNSLAALAEPGVWCITPAPASVNTPGIVRQQQLPVTAAGACAASPTRLQVPGRWTRWPIC